MELRSAGEIETKTLRKTFSSATLSTKNLILSHPGLKQGLCGDNPTPDSLVNGMGATQQTGIVKSTDY